MKKIKLAKAVCGILKEKNCVILSEVYSPSGSVMTREKQGETIFQKILGWNADNRKIMTLLSEKLRWRLRGTHLILKRMSLTTDSENVTLKSLQKT